MVSGRISFGVLRIKRFRGFDDSLESHENMIYRSTFFFTLLLMFTCPPRIISQTISSSVLLLLGRKCCAYHVSHIYVRAVAMSQSFGRSQ
jgi:hypothetical protein